MNIQLIIYPCSKYYSEEKGHLITVFPKSSKQREWEPHLYLKVYYLKRVHEQGILEYTNGKKTKANF